MSEKIQGVYEIRNTVNGKRYIGSSINIKGRWAGHKASLKSGLSKNIKLLRAWSKYGESDFEFGIIEIVTGDKEELYKREQHWIDFYDSVNSGYNICKAAGSVAGITRSKETRHKMSVAKIGKKPTDETREKISKTKTGVPMSGEAKLKMSESHKGMFPSEETREKLRKAQAGENNPMYGRCGKENPFYGKHHTDETKEQLRKMRSGKNSYWFGKTRSDETRAKMSESAKGKVRSEETEAKRLMSFNLTWDAKKGAGNRHPNYGKPIDEEVRIKMSEAKSGERHPMFGKTHSEETKAKMSAAAKKRWADKKALKTTT